MSRSDIEQFFDALSAHWDDKADDDLSRVRTLFEPIGIQRGEAVLDLACGTGVVTGLLHELSEAPVHGLDIAPGMIEKAKAKYEGKAYASFEVGDFSEYQGGRYDVIVIYNAYPHFVDRELFIAALKNHLNPGGRFAVVHSLGRERLRSHHDGLGPAISRNLFPVEEEAKAFEKEFDVLVADEGPDFYRIIGRLTK